MAKPWKIKGVTPGSEFGRAAKVIVATKYSELMSHARSDASPPDEIAIHDMRISAKRLREVLNLFRDGLSPKRAKAARSAVSSLNDSLGGVRDCDVLLSWLGRADELELSPEEAKAIEYLRTRATSDRDAALAEFEGSSERLLAERLPKALAALVGKKTIRNAVKRHG